MPVLTGKVFRLTRDTLAIETFEAEAERRPISLPAGTVIRVVRNPRPDDMRLVDVRWNNKKLVMFAEDLQTRGKPLTRE